MGIKKPFKNKGLFYKIKAATYSPTKLQYHLR